jgi:hypothetical protein
VILPYDLHSFGSPSPFVALSEKSTKLSSPSKCLEVSMISVVSVPAGQGAISSIRGIGKAILRRVEAVPQPEEDGSDFGQSFLWYGKNLAA